jgi:predicted RNase H-like HicB family nuclease
MNKVNDAIHVSVEYCTDDEAYGPVYVATCKEIAVVTDGKTLDELLANLREAVSVHLENTDTVKQFGLVANPRLIITLKLPQDYAQTA